MFRLPVQSRPISCWSRPSLEPKTLWLKHTHTHTRCTMHTSVAVAVVTSIYLRLLITLPSSRVIKRSRCSWVCSSVYLKLLALCSCSKIVTVEQWNAGSQTHRLYPRLVLNVNRLPIIDCGRYHPQSLKGTEMVTGQVHRFRHRGYIACYSNQPEWRTRISIQKALFPLSLPLCPLLPSLPLLSFYLLSLTNPAQGLGERCKLPIGSGRRPAKKVFSCILT